MRGPVWDASTAAPLTTTLKTVPVPSGSQTVVSSSKDVVENMVVTVVVSVVISREGLHPRTLLPVETTGSGPLLQSQASLKAG
jgi:hypothetical protein